MASVVPQLPDLNAGAGYHVDWTLLGNLDRARQRAGLDEGVAAHDFLRLDEGAIGHMASLDDGSPGFEALAWNDLLVELCLPGAPGSVLRLHFFWRRGLGRCSCREAVEIQKPGLGRGHALLRVGRAGRWAGCHPKDARACSDWTQRHKKFRAACPPPDRRLRRRYGSTCANTAATARSLSRCCQRQRQAHLEDGTGSLGRRAQAHDSAMQLADVTHDCKAQSGAFLIAAAEPVESIERS